ncbi:MAG: hypothetical protein IPL78_32030 [Chloroflexi bacterium]|nr:hypothetical protein [Chloroflexota bacterium]
MQEREAIFHAKLEELEAGKPLELCLVGLNEEDAAALRLVTAMRAAAYPAQDPETVMAYRAQVLLRAAQAGKMASTRQVPNQKPSVPTFLDQLRGQLDWLLTRRALAGVMVALFVGACLLVSGLAAIRLGTVGRNTEIAGIGGDNASDKTPQVTGSLDSTDSNGDDSLPGSGVPSATAAAALPHEILCPLCPTRLCLMLKRL